MRQYPIVISINGGTILDQTKLVSVSDISRDLRLRELNELLALLNLVSEKQPTQVKGMFTQSLGSFIQSIKDIGTAELTISVSTRLNMDSKTIEATFAICGQT